MTVEYKRAGPIPGSFYVGVEGIEPSASRSRTERSTDEPHPEYPDYILKTNKGVMDHALTILLIC